MIDTIEFAAIFVGVAVLAVVAYVLQERGKARKKAEERQIDDTKVPCPYCREPVSKSAAICPHCRQAIPLKDLTEMTKLRADGFLLGFVVLAGVWMLFFRLFSGHWFAIS